jgi:ABC-type multidrug transport system permease subunit
MTVTVGGRATRAPRAGRHPGTAGVLWRQTRHELLAMARVPITLILSIGLPLVFFVILAAFVGNEVVDPSTGIRLVQFLAPGMAAFGVVMATFAFLAIGVSEARSTGVVKRQAGTPVPGWVLVAGRMGAALILGMVATGLVIAAGLVFYDLQVPPRTLGALVVTLVLASLCFSALGYALAVALPTMQMTIAVANGSVILLAFVSEMFSFGGDMPAWMSGVGWFFPLRHLTASLQEVLDPYGSGAGFAWEHLAVLALWGLAGVLVATLLLRRERGRAGASATVASKGHHESDRVARSGGAPSAWALVWSQVGHTQSILWRDWSAVFFAMAFPLALAVIIPTVSGGGDLMLDSGQPLGTFYAATMAVYGAAVTAYVNMPQGLAEDRERGVLKRLRATPLPAVPMLVGRVVGALVISLLTGAAILVVAAVIYQPAYPPALPAAVLTLVVASVCFAVVGLAVSTFAKSAQAGTGLALGTLLPLAFISDIFVVGAQFPPVIDTIGWFFPLRHAANAMTTAIAPNVIGSGLSWDHLAVMLAWTAAGAAVLAWRFRWMNGESGPTGAEPKVRVSD